MVSFVFLLVSLFLPYLYRVAMEVVVLEMVILEMVILEVVVTDDAGWSFVGYMSSGANTNSVGT